MSELRHSVFPSESTVKQYVQRSRRQPFFTTDYVRYFHQMVVYNICQMISRQFVSRFIKNLIVKDRRVDNYIATDNVVYMNIFIWFNLETNYILLSVSYELVNFFFRQSQRVTHLQTCVCIVLEVRDFFALSFQLFRSIESNICFSVIEKHLYIFLVNISTFRLTIRAIVSAKAYTFVESNAQPFKRFKNIFFCTWHKTIRVGIFDTEYQIATMLTSKQVVI